MSKLIDSKFKETLKNHYANICEVYIYFHTFKDINNLAKSNKDKLSYSFFGTSRRALYYMSCMSIAKLFDKNKATENIPKLLETASQNLGLVRIKNAKQKISSLQIELAKHATIIKNLIGKRNEYYAHNDKNFFRKPQLLSKKYPLAITDLETLLKFAIKVLDKLTGEKTVFKPLDDDFLDLKYLLADIKKSD